MSQGVGRLLPPAAHAYAWCVSDARVRTVPCSRTSSAGGLPARSPSKSRLEAGSQGECLAKPSSPFSLRELLKNLLRACFLWSSESSSADSRFRLGLSSGPTGGLVCLCSPSGQGRLSHKPAFTRLARVDTRSSRQAPQVHDLSRP